MEIKKQKNDKELIVTVSGRLDTTTAPDLEAELKDSLDGIDKLVFEIGNLDYISSAGLRVFLAVQKVMNQNGVMTVRNAQEPIMEIFEVTGFTDILTLEHD